MATGTTVRFILFNKHLSGGRNVLETTVPNSHLLPRIGDLIPLNLYGSELDRMGVVRAVVLHHALLERSSGVGFATVLLEDTDIGPDSFHAITCNSDAFSNENVPYKWHYAQADNPILWCLVAAECAGSKYTP
jgi:hypothetical protein